MKNYVRLFVLTLVAALVFAACNFSDDGDGSPPPVNDIAAGVMTEETAAEIFESEDDGDGVKIIKLKSVDALANYMSSASETAKQSVSFGPNRVSGGKGVFFLNKIGSKFVVSIGAGAFTPGEGEDTLADIGIKSFKLPENLVRIEPDAFTGQLALTLIIPETVAAAVVTAIKEAADKADLPEPKTEEEAADPDNPDDSEDYSLKISGKQVYKTDGGEFTGNAVLYAVSNALYEGTRDLKDVGEEVGKIENGILTLSLPELPPAQFDNEPWGGRGIEYFYIMENGVQQRVALELLKAGSVKMTQRFSYISDLNKYNSFKAAEDLPDINAGWNICQGEIWQGNEAPRTLEEYEAAGYKWVYTDNPLAGTFIKYATEHDDGNLVADKYTFTPDASKTQGHFSHETTFENSPTHNCTGSYTIDIEKGELTFTPNPSTGSGTLTRMLDTAVNGAVIEPLGGDEKDDGGGYFGLYLKDGSIW